ncbi:mitochondrial carrier domain-containing protein [Flagelloscypha sp. PMI_526]|nr:mitochondrial carrier domain-containing protein [Flagelloscypha sp. PMI_526]
MFILLEILVAAFVIAISLGILIPFTGVLVRFRANYNPKALRLDAEGEAQAHTGPVIESYFAMFVRTWKIEGWPGLYKGIMPTGISSIIFATVLLLFFDAPSHSHGKYRAPDASFLGQIVFAMMNVVVYLPAMVISYRFRLLTLLPERFTTPYRLPWFDLKLALRFLLTPTERRKPYLLYLTPGLLASELLRSFLVIGVLGPLRSWLIPENLSRGELPSPFRLAMYITAVVLSVPILTPLEVIGTRLAIQRTHSPVDYTAVPQESEMDAADAPDYYAESEDVIGLRNEEDPYIGLYDCFKRIIDEEGFRALFRAWWLTLLGGLGSVLG